MEYAILIAGWALYFLVHSTLAADRVKRVFRMLLRGGFRFYRIAYSIISTVGLAALLFLNAWADGPPLAGSSGLIRYLSLMVATVGVIIVSRAFKEYDAFAFVGLRPENSKFVRRGILNYVRHPIYSGTILIVIGFFLFTPTLASLVSMLCIFIYLPIGIHLEERKLIRYFGEAYKKYKQEVPSVFPRLGRRF